MAAPDEKRGREKSENHVNAHLGTGPYKKPCRACFDSQSWIKMYGSKQRSAIEGSDSSSKSTITTDTSVEGHKECPLDKDELGRRTWSFLHTTAAYYPEKPTEKQQKDMKEMMYTFSRFYPCDFCAKDFRKSMKINAPDTSSQHCFSQWMCQMHNEVNRKLGKPEFDCNNVNERWRDGWKDGSCD